jgi:integrase
LRVSRQLVPYAPQGWNKVSYSPTKTSGSNRSVPLEPETTLVLREEQHLQQGLRASLGMGWTEDDLVFATLDGRPLRPASVTRAFGDLVQRLGMPKLTLHGLRRTFGAHALATGTHPVIVSRVMGHSRPAFTMLMYSPFLPGVAEDAVRQMVRAMRAEEHSAVKPRSSNPSSKSKG